MELLNKNNSNKQIFYILFIIFILIFGNLMLLKELESIHESKDKCPDKCLDNNMTAININDVCQCCTNMVQSSKKETLIENRCYEVITTNVTEE